jgi:hypothetical protein
MDDSTSSQIAARQSRQDAALDEAIVSASRCDLFLDALTEYGTAYSRVDTLHGDETALLPISSVVTWASRNLVIAAADYHCATMVFEAQKALIAVESEGA